MASAPNPTRSQDRKLHLREVLDWMVEDGVLGRVEATKVLEDARSALRQTRHPALTIGESRRPWRYAANHGAGTHDQ